MDISEAIWLALACASAIACGFSLWQAFEAWRRQRRHRASISGDGETEGAGKGPHSAGDFALGYAELLTRDLALKKKRSLSPSFIGAPKSFQRECKLAGLTEKVSAEGFSEARVRLAALGAVAGFGVGLLFSVELSIVGLMVGAALGFQAPGRAIRTRAKVRANEVERHLPEMLDVVALGMRSGLSFDSSLHIYASHFDTLLAKELECARVKWSSGLERRDEALRALASTYDSAIFSRVVETIVKSIRYGSSMVSSLEADASEARGVYQSEREERIAKAPVKMMVPTGTLILPAMLIMVLGPVLLELMQGGF